MKAITLTPPWGTLVAIGAKRIETRAWSTNYRGPLAIHQAKLLNGLRRRDDEVRVGTRELEKRLADLCDQDPFFPALRGHLSGYTAAERAKDLPRGAIVAVVNLADCIRTEHVDIASWIRSHHLGHMAHPQLRALVEQERAFGDYTPGRYAWTFDRLVNLHDGIECAGGRGLWDVPEHVLQELADVVDVG